MKHDADVRSTEAGESLASAVDRARASYAAGGGVEHRVVGEWLATWGKPGQTRFEEWLAAWHG